MSVIDVVHKVRDLVDRESRTMSRVEYRELLDEIASEVQCREMALDEDGEEDEG